MRVSQRNINARGCPTLGLMEGGAFTQSPRIMRGSDDFQFVRFSPQKTEEGLHEK